MNKKTMEFISLCIETYKTKYKKSGKGVIELFDNYGITDFLIEGYDILHTQSIQYVIEEIELYLENRGYGTITPKSYSRPSSARSLPERESSLN